jgi:hypothetical protein
MPADLVKVAFTVEALMGLVLVYFQQRLFGQHTGGAAIGEICGAGKTVRRVSDTAFSTVPLAVRLAPGMSVFDAALFAV